MLAVLQSVSAVFRARFIAWTLRHRTGHTVVVGAGPEAYALARRQAETATTVLIGSDTDRDVARRYRLHVVRGDPVEAATLTAAGVAGAARVFALAEQGAVNAGVALLVRSLHRRDVAVYARATDRELVAALRARRLGAEGDRGYRLDFFSIETTATLALLDEHDKDVTRPVAVIGADRFAGSVAAALRHRRRRRQPPAPVPHVDPAQLSTVESASSVAHARTGTTYVCGPDPDEVLRLGLNLLLAGHEHVVLCLDRRSVLADALEERLFDDVLGRLSVFGVLDAACNPEVLERSALVERLARALHERYLEEYRGQTPRQPSHVEWDDLADRFKADNRAQAEHIGVKLAAINAAIVPATPGLPEFSLGAAEVERLAELEHQRWMVNKNDPAHPDMRAWNDGLSEAAKEKDRMFVRGLPALLADEDLAIVRRTEPGPAD